MSTTYTFDEDTVSDLHKDAYGFRPKGNFWSAWAAFNGDQKQALWDSMCKTLERNQELEAEIQSQAADQFDRTIVALIESGARNRSMALRWLHEAHDTNGDDEYLESLLTLPFRYIAKSRALEENGR